MLDLDSIYCSDVKANWSKLNGWTPLDWLLLDTASKLVLVSFDLDECWRQFGFCSAVLLSVSQRSVINIDLSLSWEFILKFYFSSFEHEWICQIVHTNWHDQTHWFPLTLRQYRFIHLSIHSIATFRNV